MKFFFLKKAESLEISFQQILSNNNIIIKIS